MSDIIEFAKILRQAALGWDKGWVTDLVDILDAAIEEFEKTRDGIFAPREDVAIGRWLAGETPASICIDYGESENWSRNVVRKALWHYRRDEKSRGRNQVCDADERLGTQAGETPAPSPTPFQEDQQRIADLIAALAAVEIEMERLTTSGIIEVAVRNPNVRDYMDHWEQRAEAAETEVMRLNKKCGYWEAEVARLNAECAHWMSKWGRAQDRIATLESRGRQEEPSAP